MVLRSFMSMMHAIDCLHNKLAIDAKTIELNLKDDRIPLRHYTVGDVKKYLKDQGVLAR
jgi:hypothetical protein